MKDPTFQSVDVFLPYLFNVDQCALPSAEGVVLKSGKLDQVVFFVHKSDHPNLIRYERLEDLKYPYVGGNDSIQIQYQSGANLDRIQSSTAAGIDDCSRFLKNERIEWYDREQVVVTFQESDYFFASPPRNGVLPQPPVKSTMRSQVERSAEIVQQGVLRLLLLKVCEVPPFLKLDYLYERNCILWE